MTDRMTNAKKPTAAMVEAGLTELRGGYLNAPIAHFTQRGIVAEIYTAMRALEPAAPVEDGEVVLSSIRTWITGLPHDLESRPQVLADLDRLASQPPAADALVSAATHLADEMDGLLPYLASHNWRLDRLHEAVANVRAALAKQQGGGE